MKPVFAIALALLVVACASKGEPPVRTVEVRVPVPTPCNPQIGPAPSYPDTNAALLAASPEDMLRLFYGGRTLRDARIAELEAGIRGCAG